VRTQTVIEAAGEHKVELLFVPNGATGEVELLDRRIFGELKYRSRAEFQT
jgi:hypothetical protein